MYGPVVTPGSRVGAAEQGAGVQAAVVGEPAQVGDGGGGDRFLAVAAVGDVAGQGEPVALGHLAGERLAVQGWWRLQGPLPGVRTLQLEREGALGVGQLEAAAQRDPSEVFRAAAPECPQQRAVGGGVDLAEVVVGQGFGEVGQPDDVVAVLVAVGLGLGERVAQLLLGGGDTQLEGAGAAGLQIQRGSPSAAPGLGGGGPRRGRLLRTRPSAAGTHQRCRSQPADAKQEPPPTR